MLKAVNLAKHFDGFPALDSLTCAVPSGSIYGVVGSNGAGKSTLLRLFTGIYKPDGGVALLGADEIFENPSVKESIHLVPDELYFLPQASLKRMAALYSRSFPNFSYEYFDALVGLFQLDQRKPIRTFSKGMKRQSAIILALSCKPKYLLLDEAFDGLDPLMRDLVRKILARDVAERGTTVIISSHSLRELEDTCDWLSLLHKGNLIFESRKDDLMTQASQGLETLFIERLKQAGYDFDDQLAALYREEENVHHVERDQKEVAA